MIILGYLYYLVKLRYRWFWLDYLYFSSQIACFLSKDRVLYVYVTEK